MAAAFAEIAIGGAGDLGLLRVTGSTTISVGRSLIESAGRSGLVGVDDDAASR